MREARDKFFDSIWSDDPLEMALVFVHSFATLSGLTPIGQEDEEFAARAIAKVMMTEDGFFETGEGYKDNRQFWLMQMAYSLIRAATIVNVHDDDDGVFQGLPLDAETKA